MKTKTEEGIMTDASIAEAADRRKYQTTMEECWADWGQSDQHLTVEYKTVPRPGCAAVAILPGKIDVIGKYAAWAAGRVFVSTGPALALPRVDLDDISALLARKSDGAYVSCNNMTWRIARDEGAALIALQEERDLRAIHQEELAELAKKRRGKVSVPEPAIDAYRRYGGDAERAWADEETVAYDLLRKYGKAIEDRGLARRA